MGSRRLLALDPWAKTSGWCDRRTSGLSQAEAEACETMQDSTSRTATIHEQKSWIAGVQNEVPLASQEKRNS
jgi:hypothetical protein